MWGPFPNSKTKVGSRSNRCQNEASVQADNLLKFGVDRLSRFGDRGRRKFCSVFSAFNGLVIFHASDALKHGYICARSRVNSSKE
jgi:hypothetical protein